MTPSAQTAGGRRVRRWTRELIIEKILEWEARYGEPPCSADWNPSLARWRAQEWRAERYREGVWPSTNAAKRPFGGSFDAAVRAAGLEPRRPGPRRGAGEARPVVGAARGAATRERARLDRVPRPVRPRWSASCSWPKAGPSVPRRSRSTRAAVRAVPVTAVRASPCAWPAGPTRSSAWRPRSPTPTRASAPARTRSRPRCATPPRRAEAAAAAERRARELSALVANGQRRLTGRGAERAARRRGVRPAVLAAALRRLAKARAAGDRAGLRAALGEIASAAVRWHDRL